MDNLVCNLSRNLIGIISYLPDDKDKRMHRFVGLVDLIHTCNKIFNYELHIFVLIQNYTENEILALYRIPNVECSFNYPKLGIVGARRQLRNEFLNGHYENLIMLDDDSVIEGSSVGGKKYLEQLDNHPGMFYEFQDTLLKLFAISKEVFAEQDFIDVNPEKEEGFEDRVFVNVLRHKFPNKRYVFEKNGLQESSISTSDKMSTWYTNQDNKKMLNNTEEIINKIINC